MRSKSEEPFQKQKQNKTLVFVFGSTPSARASKNKWKHALGACAKA
jgi:hypothetical protein